MRPGTPVDLAEALVACSVSSSSSFPPFLHSFHLSHRKCSTSISTLPAFPGSHPQEASGTLHLVCVSISADLDNAVAEPGSHLLLQACHQSQGGHTEVFLKSPLEAASQHAARKRRKGEAEQSASPPSHLRRSEGP